MTAIKSMTQKHINQSAAFGRNIPAKWNSERYSLKGNRMHFFTTPFHERQDIYA